MSLDVRQTGADEVSRKLAALAEDLVLTDADQSAGSLVAVVARRLAPRLTGALAETVDATVTGALVEVTAGGGAVDYAVPVHKRNPFMTKAAGQTVDDVIDLYTKAVQDAATKT